VTARNDLQLYEDHADRWWRPGDRFFRSLRSVGAFHLEVLLGDPDTRIADARVAELGCGGGIASLALAARGARVVGVDRSRSSLRAARREAERRGTPCAFVLADLCNSPLPTERFDLVVMTDVLEHLEQPARALREAARLLRPGGRVFLSTFDRTRASELAVVVLAEGLGLVPRGTHDARLFVRPAELERYARESGLRVERLLRERPALVRTVLTWTIHLRHSRRGPGFCAFLRKEHA